MRRGRLRPRLLGSFVAVALVGVATLGLLVSSILPGELSRLVVERQDQAARRAAEALGEGHRRGRPWSEDDLGRAGRAADTGDGPILISTDSTTSPPTASPSPPPGSGPGPNGPRYGGGGGAEGGGDTPTMTPSTGQGGDGGSQGGQGGTGASSGSAGGRSGTGGAVAAPAANVIGVNAAGVEGGATRSVEVPIVTDGEVVGSLTVEYPAGGLPGPEQDLQSSLRRAIVVASVVAIVVALLVALLVARRLTQPLERLTAAARRLGAGDLSTRVKEQAGPGEMGELAATFDQMADSLAHEDEVRRALVADVAHEIRTPVTVLQASLEQLVDGSLEPEVERLSSLHDEVLRLATILEDLQSLAAAQAAVLEMEVRPVDLAEVATDAVERLRDSFETAEIAPRTDLESTIVLGDASRLDQVVTNLLTNALKFSPPGGEVHVRVSGDHGEARMEVDDEGPGIPAEEIDHVFERFWRGGAARAVSGSGVGLAVVAELVRAHHGHVEVASPPGEGAHFLVTLPAA